MQTQSGERGRAFLQQAAVALPHDSLALAVIDADAPAADGFLALKGITAQRLLDWCNHGHRRDELWRAALRTGSSATATRNPRDHAASDPINTPLLPQPATLVQVLPASLDHRRVWLLAAGRTADAFSDAERRQASLLLRLKQLDFDYCREPGLGRLLLDSQDRLIHADPRLEARLLEAEHQINQLAPTLRQVIAQRWPQGMGWRVHDAFLEVLGKPTWVRFRACSPDPAVPAHLFVELRPIGPDDPPVIGVISDDRIARALAFIYDRYADAPNLNDAAEAAGISPFHFHRLFTRAIGVSPKHVLLRMQMLVAKHQLVTTRDPINAIALATGFASHGHFTATFHRLVGVSPTHFREAGRPLP